MELWREALGWIGSAVLVLSTVQPTISRLRWLNLMAAALLAAYNLWLGSAPMVAVNVVLVAVNAWHLGRAARSLRESPRRAESEGRVGARIAPGAEGEPLR